MKENTLSRHSALKLGFLTPVWNQSQVFRLQTDPLQTQKAEGLSGHQIPSPDHKFALYLWEIQTEHQSYYGTIVSEDVHSDEEGEWLEQSTVIREEITVVK